MPESQRGFLPHRPVKSMLSEPPVPYLEESEMSWKGDTFRESSLRRWFLAIIILCTSGWWAFADALAQESAPAQLKMTAPLTLWSLEGPGSDTAPYLVIGMADRRDTPSYGPLRLVRDEAANPSAKNTVSRTPGPVTYVSAPKKENPVRQHYRVFLRQLQASAVSRIFTRKVRSGARLFRARPTREAQKSTAC